MATDFEKVLLDPASEYSGPEDVLSDQSLSIDQKIELLRRWEYNASEEAVALEEGMPGEESDLLKRILVTIGKIAGPLDLEHTGPSKQHGLPKRAVWKR